MGRLVCRARRYGNGGLRQHRRSRRRRWRCQLGPSTLPEPTVTHTQAPTSTLATSDWDDTGYQAPIVLALLPATISGSADITVDPVTAIDGDLVVASDLTIDGVERIGIGIRLRRTGAARLDFYFDDAGSPMYPDAKAFIVIDDTARTQIPFSIAATAGGFNNWSNRRCRAASSDNRHCHGRQVRTGDCRACGNHGRSRSRRRRRGMVLCSFPNPRSPILPQPPRLITLLTLVLWPSPSTSRSRRSRIPRVSRSIT